MRITAAVTAHKGAPFTLEQVELGPIRPDEVLVRIAAAGICHTDLIVRDQWYPVPLPAVLGHEGAGVVEQVGADVTAVEPGDHVALSYHLCGHRPRRARRPAVVLPRVLRAQLRRQPPRRHERHAARRCGPAAHFFGQSSFATHSVANRATWSGSTRTVPLEIAAPFGCGIQTGAGAVLNVLRAGGRDRDRRVRHGRRRPRRRAPPPAIAGCTTIIGVDRHPARLETARDLGATHTIAAQDEDAVAAVDAHHRQQEPISASRRPARRRCSVRRSSAPRRPACAA